MNELNVQYDNKKSSSLANKESQSQLNKNDNNVNKRRQILKAIKTAMLILCDDIFNVTAVLVSHE